jgi:hypothetical protein
MELRHWLVFYLGWRIQVLSSKMPPIIYRYFHCYCTPQVSHFLLYFSTLSEYPSQGSLTCHYDFISMAISMIICSFNFTHKSQAYLKYFCIFFYSALNFLSQEYILFSESSYDPNWHLNYQLCGRIIMSLALVVWVVNCSTHHHLNQGLNCLLAEEES